MEQELVECSILIASLNRDWEELRRLLQGLLRSERARLGLALDRIQAMIEEIDGGLR